MDKEKSIKIFAMLMEGKFISDNSSNYNSKKLFDEIAINKEEYSTLYELCGYKLECEDTYFYVSKMESKTDLERKLEQIFHLAVYVLNFLLAIDGSIGPEVVFTSSYLEKKTVESIELKELLHEIYPGKETIKDMIEKLCKELETRGFIENVSFREGKYKVLSSFNYLKELQDKITIKD